MSIDPFMNRVEQLLDSIPRTRPTLQNCRPSNQEPLMHSPYYYFIVGQSADLILAAYYELQRIYLHSKATHSCWPTICQTEHTYGICYLLTVVLDNIIKWLYSNALWNYYKFLNVPTELNALKIIVSIRNIG